MGLKVAQAILKILFEIHLVCNHNHFHYLLKSENNQIYSNYLKIQVIKRNDIGKCLLE